MARRASPLLHLSDAIKKLTYKNGKLYWVVHRGGKAKIGAEAGWVDGDGYRALRLKNSSGETTFRAHRLIWFMFHGRFPLNQIDHKNRNRTDNRISNLREATNSVNQHNSKTRKDNATGFTGVHYKDGSYCARISINGKRVHLGYFATPELASNAYLAKKNILSAKGLI